MCNTGYHQTAEEASHAVGTHPRDHAAAASRVTEPARQGATAAYHCAGFISFHIPIHVPNVLIVLANPTNKHLNRGTSYAITNVPHLVDCVGGVDSLPSHRGKLNHSWTANSWFTLEEYRRIRSLPSPPHIKCTHADAHPCVHSIRGIPRFLQWCVVHRVASVGSPQVKAASCSRGKLFRVCWYWWQHSNGTRRRAVGQKDHCRRRGSIVVERGGAFDDTVLLWCRYSAVQRSAVHLMHSRHSFLILDFMPYMMWVLLKSHIWMPLASDTVRTLTTCVCVCVCVRACVCIALLCSSIFSPRYQPPFFLSPLLHQPYKNYVSKTIQIQNYGRNCAPTFQGCILGCSTHYLGRPKGGLKGQHPGTTLRAALVHVA